MVRTVRSLALTHPHRQVPNVCAPCVRRVLQGDTVGATAPPDGPRPAALAFVRLGACSAYQPLPCSRATVEALNQGVLMRLLRALPGFREYLKDPFLDAVTRVHVLKGPLTADTPTASDEAKDNIVELPDNLVSIAVAAPRVATSPHLFIRIPTPRRELQRSEGSCASPAVVPAGGRRSRMRPSMPRCRCACSAVAARALR